MKKIYITTIIFIVLDILIGVGIYLIKGPLANELMNKITNKKLVYSIWDEDEVWENIVSIDTENLNDDLVTEIKDDIKINDYEKQIITKDKGNENYKLINLKVDGYAAYMAVIYDPSGIELLHIKKFNVYGTSSSRGAETIMSMCKRYGDTVCINGGKFEDEGIGSDTPVGYLIDDGKIIWQDNNGKSKSKIIGFTKDHKLTLMNSTGAEALEAGIVEGLSFGPFLIENGEYTKITDFEVGGYLKASRVAIAQRADGIVLFLVADGVHGTGATIKGMRDTLNKYGAINAANLDGGASSQLVINGKIINKPKNIYGDSMGNGRGVVSGFGVKFN